MSNLLYSHAGEIKQPGGIIPSEEPSELQEPQIEQVEQAVQRARDYLLGLQHPEGYWVGELEADASVAAGYIPLMYWMTGKVDPARQQKVVNYVLGKQNPDGSWSTFHGGPGSLLEGGAARRAPDDAPHYEEWIDCAGGAFVWAILEAVFGLQVPVRGPVTISRAAWDLLPSARIENLVVGGARFRVTGGVLEVM